MVPTGTLSLPRNRALITFYHSTQMSTFTTYSLENEKKKSKCTLSLYNHLFPSQPPSFVSSSALLVCHSLGNCRFGQYIDKKHREESLHCKKSNQKKLQKVRQQQLPKLFNNQDAMWNSTQWTWQSNNRTCTSKEILVFTETNGKITNESI